MKTCKKQNIAIHWSVGQIVAVAVFASCQAVKIKEISHRDPMPVFATSAVPVPAPEPVAPKDTSALFVRSKELKLRKKSPVNETGSLTDLNDPRAYLFGFERPIEVGTFLEVKIGSNRTDTPAAGAADSASAKNNEVDEASLIKALPNLEAGSKDKPVLVKNIKMQILERFDNGDVLVMYRRRSMQEGQAAEILVTARLSAAALSRPEQVSTSDLADVDWHQSAVGEMVERKSTNWEDEYSLRISGFDEAKSKVAAGLEEKREKLKEVRDKLETELKAFDGQRKVMTTERSTLLDEKAKDTAKIDGLNEENSDLKKQVEDLTPKELALEDSAAVAPAAKAKSAAKGDAKGAKAADPKADKKAAKAPDKAAKAPADKNAAADKKKETKKAEAKPAKPKAAKG